MSLDEFRTEPVLSVRGFQAIISLFIKDLLASIPTAW
jgi:hypothetical protein